ncbi:MAG: hypothetical protein AABW86_04970 [Candidatus Micrarchaeota archaeon]
MNSHRYADKPRSNGGQPQRPLREIRKLAVWTLYAQNQADKRQEAEDIALRFTDITIQAAEAELGRLTQRYRMDREMRTRYQVHSPALRQCMKEKGWSL